MFICTLMLSLPKSALLLNMIAMEQLFCIKIALKQQHYVFCVICILYTPPSPSILLKSVCVQHKKCNNGGVLGTYYYVASAPLGPY